MSIKLLSAALLFKKGSPQLVASRLIWQIFIYLTLDALPDKTSLEFVSPAGILTRELLLLGGSIKHYTM